MSAPNTVQSTTQQFLDIYDITNDLLIMKDGATALIITVNAINFGLFAEAEQDAVIYAYAGLLNSLNYPIQIVVKSQTKDVTAYLQLLKEQEDQTSDPLKRERIKRYRLFVSDLIREGNVLDKKFYVSIPANALEMGLVPPSTVIPGVKKIDISGVERSIILEKARNILEPKRDHLIAQFGRIGLQARQLKTQEIIQLFYTSYNPEAAEGLQVSDTRSYTTPVVNAQIQSSAFAQTPQSTTQYQPNLGVMTMTDQNQPTVATPTPAMTPAPAAPIAPAAPVEVVAPVAPVEPVSPPPATPPAADPQVMIETALQELGTPAPGTQTAPGSGPVAPTPPATLPEI